MARPRDGIRTKFNEEVMPELMTLVPDFDNEKAANAWYQHMIGLQWFKRRYAAHHGRRLFDAIYYDLRPYVCTDQADPQWQHRHDAIELGPNRRNPMQALHILAHILQPEDGPWHGGAFAQTFLDLIERAFNIDKRRTARQILLKHKVKTKVMNLTDEQRSDRAKAFMERQQPDIEAGLREILADMQEIKERHKRD